MPTSVRLITLHSILIYGDGDGVQKDLTESLKWTKLAAEQGHAKAQYNLGIMYRNGKGVSPNNRIAAKWYTLAAEQGYAAAQTNLGVMYSTGQGVVQDIVYAYLWVSMAAANGNELGEKLKGAFARLLTPSQTVEVQSQRVFGTLMIWVHRIIMESFLEIRFTLS